MKIKTPLTRARIRTHMTYHWWNYAAVVLASVFCWNLLYITTAYRSPEELRIDLYIQSPSVTEESAASFIDPIWKSTVPTMETVTSVLLSGSTEDYYANMQLSVYLMAAEGDLYLLCSSDFKSYAAQGVFVDLQPYVDQGLLDVDGLDLSAGYVAQVDEEGVPNGEMGLYGIPAYALNGLRSGMLLDNSDIVIGMTVFNGNEENVLAFLNGLIAAGRDQLSE